VKHDTRPAFLKWQSSPLNKTNPKKELSSGQLEDSHKKFLFLVVWRLVRECIDNIITSSHHEPERPSNNQLNDNKPPGGH
jgi:hypothetical protein